VFDYQCFHVVFREKDSQPRYEKIFTNCTLENTFAMLDTTIREVNLDKYREIKIQNGKGESCGFLGEEKE
jgi:hypothetical protein